jgi:hypothetical protein
MPRKDTAAIASGFGTWKAPQKSIAEGIEALQKHFSAIMKQRRETQLRDAAANRKVTAALAKEWKKAGIDLSNVAAVCHGNAVRYQADFKKYRNRKPPTRVKDPRISRYLSGRNVRGFAPAPSNQFSVVRTPPYDAFALFTPSPPTTPTTFWFRNADFDGSMNYFQDTPITSPTPSNFVVGGAVGITFSPPPIFGVPWPFFGFASVQMNAGNTLEMSGHVGANAFGYSHSQGDVGWAIEEFDENNNFLGFIQNVSTDEFYIDADFGQSFSAFVAPPTFTSQTSFVTFPLSKYIILVTLWGNIDASGASGLGSLWSSQAAGFGEMVVQSMSVTWSPSFLP